MDLSGTWKAAPATEEHAKVFHDPATDDSDWVDLTVPGHWAEVDELGPDLTGVLHRRRFTGPDPDPGDRWWLVLDGIFYQSDVWLDGTYLGDTEGYFAPAELEVTEELSLRSEHLLALEVACDPQGTDAPARSVLGAFDHERSLVPGQNPGGIWAPIRLERSGPVRLRRLRAVCTAATAERATVALRAVLDCAEPGHSTIATRLCGAETSEQRPLAAGENTVEWTVTVEQPERWWPVGLGDQRLHRLEVVVCSPAGQRSDHRSLDIGLRTVRMRRWVLSVNGERIFLKGVNLAPLRAHPAHVRTDDVAAVVARAGEAHLNLLRPYGHIAHPLLYDAADRAGLLVWQDLPLVGPAGRGVRREAVRQAKAAVDLLAHHPSIMLWCGHVRPVGDVMHAGATTWRDRVGILARHELPTWSKSVLDRTVKRALDSQDGTRPVVAYSGVLPHPPRLEATDSHLWLGWRGETERELSTLARAVPSLVRFVSEFGAQSVPDSDEVISMVDPDGDFPDLDWDRLAGTLGMEASSFQRYVTPSVFTTFDAWQQATTTYQAVVVRRQIETLRRLKYRPTGGFSVHFLADNHPTVSSSLIDHRGEPKAAWAAVVAACAPVIVVADRLPRRLAPGTTIDLDVHIVSDLRRAPAEQGIIEANLRWAGGQRRWVWGGAVPADDCTRVGSLHWEVPAAAGPVTLELELTGPARASNRYDAVIAE